MENRFLRAVAFGRFCVFNPRSNLFIFGALFSKPLKHGCSLPKSRRHVILYCVICGHKLHVDGSRLLCDRHGEMRVYVEQNIENLEATL